MKNMTMESKHQAKRGYHIENKVNESTYEDRVKLNRSHKGQNRDATSWLICTLKHHRYLKSTEKFNLKKISLPKFFLSVLKLEILLYCLVYVLSEFLLLHYLYFLPRFYICYTTPQLYTSLVLLPLHKINLVLLFLLLYIAQSWIFFQPTHFK